jgi:hypothetical protein
VFPSQIIILLFAIIVLSFIQIRPTFKDQAIGFFLGFLWIWTGAVYHIIFFSSINRAAFVFGGVSIMQGALIFINAYSKDRLIFIFQQNVKNYVGYFFILFAVIIYPLIGYYTEGMFVRTISLGLPCPSTIFTFGVFMLTPDRVPKYLLVIPSLWAILGLSAAIHFGIYQDFMMVIAAITANIFLRRKKENHLTIKIREEI